MLLHKIDEKSLYIFTKPSCPQKWFYLKLDPNQGKSMRKNTNERLPAAFAFVEASCSCLLFHFRGTSLTRRISLKMRGTYCRAAASRPFLVVERRGGPPGRRVSPASSAAGRHSRGIPDGLRTGTCCPQESLPAEPPRPPPAPSCESETKAIMARCKKKNTNALSRLRCYD